MTVQILLKLDVIHSCISSENDVLYSHVNCRLTQVPVDIPLDAKKIFFMKNFSLYLFHDKMAL